MLPFRELWEYRELIYFFVWRDIKVRYKQTAIGAAWAVLQPFMTMLVFSLFFGKLAHIPSQGLPYPIFYYSALLPWMYFAGALQNSTNTIVENQRLVTKVYFPRLALPLSSVLSGLVDFGISFLMFIAMMFYYRIHAELGHADGSGLSVARRAYGARRGAVALGVKCNLSRRALRRAVSHSVLDVRVARRLSELARSCEVAMALWAESDGRRDRRISMVPRGSWHAPGTADRRFIGRSPCDST